MLKKRNETDGEGEKQETIILPPPNGIYAVRPYERYDRLAHIEDDL